MEYTFPPWVFSLYFRQPIPEDLWRNLSLNFYPLSGHFLDTHYTAVFFSKIVLDYYNWDVLTLLAEADIVAIYDFLCISYTKFENYLIINKKLTRSSFTVISFWCIMKLFTWPKLWLMYDIYVHMLC